MKPHELFSLVFPFFMAGLCLGSMVMAVVHRASQRLTPRQRAYTRGFTDGCRSAMGIVSQIEEAQPTTRIRRRNPCWRNRREERGDS